VRRITRAGTATTAAALLLLTAAACSSDDGDKKANPAASAPATSAPTGSEQELYGAVRDYSNAYLTGDGATAHALWSERCRARVSVTEMKAASRQAVLTYGNKQRINEFTSKISGEMARVTYAYTGSGPDQTDEPWVWQDGSWRNDDC